MAETAFMEYNSTQYLVQKDISDENNYEYD